jgi:HD-GYP domain-containing protein (c-di-GMP phosphodiesterase class II)
VLVRENPTKSSSRRRPSSNPAQQAALALREEFGVPFALFDPATGVEVLGSKTPARLELDATDLAEMLAQRKALVRELPNGSFRLCLLVQGPDQTLLVAHGELAGIAPGGTPEAERERGRLQKWLQAVADRLHIADKFLERRRADAESSQAAGSWEAILTLDRLIRRLRVHKQPAKNQQRILDAAFKQLRVQTLIWVPQQSDVPMIILGEPLLAPPESRALADCLSQHPDYRPLEPLLCNDLKATGWANRFPQVTNLLAFLLTDQGPIGWVIAINKGGGAREEKAGKLAAFRKSDAALLMPFAALLELHARGSARYQDLKELLVGLTRSLTAALDAKDSYTYGHSERVARIAVELGRELGLSSDELSDIYLAGLLHDVGKIGIRDSVLGKVEPLTPEEFEHIKQHVTIGYAILSDLRPIRNLLPGVLYHHEHWDGNGYPDGLAGEAIPLLARILAVADAHDAMSTNRPYRDALPCRKVEEILVMGGGTQWDKRIVEAFVRCRQKIHTIRQRGVGDSLQLAIDGALRIDKSSLQKKSDSLPE